MKAVVMEARGGPEVLKVAEVPTPEPGPKEVRIRVKAAALNHWKKLQKGIAFWRSGAFSARWCSGWIRKPGQRLPQACP